MVILPKPRLMYIDGVYLHHEKRKALAASHADIDLFMRISSCHVTISLSVIEVHIPVVIIINAIIIMYVSDCV